MHTPAQHFHDVPPDESSLADSFQWLTGETARGHTSTQLQRADNVWMAACNCHSVCQDSPESPTNQISHVHTVYGMGIDAKNELLALVHSESLL